jgi:CDP-6-deoxy-D-xylo-4-hexulose-3-dehydrase
MAAFVGCKFAVFTSSGSTANTLLAMYIRDKNMPSRNVVVLPVVTWPTSCSPWIREGFRPFFLDVSRVDFSMDITKLELYLRDHARSVAVVFITSLLGFTPNIEEIQRLARQYEVTVMLDNCESLLSEYDGRNLSSYFTSTTSTYFAHHLQSVEGGFVFTNDEKLYHYCIMARHHGMCRGLEQYQNKDVDSRFDFYCLGNNFRNTDINATIGLLDFKRVKRYEEQRMDVFSAFRALIDPVLYHLPTKRRLCHDVPHALPILRNNDWESRRDELVKACAALNIETRPIVSGNILKQTAFKQFADHPSYFPVADIIHNGIYLGLGSRPTYDLLAALARNLNAIK